MFLLSAQLSSQLSSRRRHALPYRRRRIPPGVLRGDDCHAGFIVCDISLVFILLLPNICNAKNKGSGDFVAQLSPAHGDDTHTSLQAATESPRCAQGDDLHSCFIVCVKCFRLHISIAEHFQR